MGIAALVIAAWSAFYLIDIVNVGGVGDQLPQPMWTYLFNDHLVEVTQWFTLALTTGMAGYLGGRLADTGQVGASRFFFLLSIGLGLMLVEEAGDIRHGISGAVRLHAGEEVFGLPYQVVSDMPYFAALAALPVYAVLRYGRHAWVFRPARRYLVAAVALYALASISSGLRHLGDFYIRVGGAVDRWLFGGRFPAAPEQTPERAHYMVVDSLIEETVELFAVTCMLALVLTVAAQLRRHGDDPVGDGASPSSPPPAADQLRRSAEMTTTSSRS